MRNWDAWVMAAAVFLMAAPVVWFRHPLYFFNPDIEYVKAKILRVLAGSFFTDPVTGFPNFHPPWYHVILSVPARLGIGLDTLLRYAAVQNVVLIPLFSWLILERLFDRRTALYTALLVPFLFQHMGPGQIYLATAFYYSLPFYLAGLWLYLGPSTITKNLLTALLWGMAFLISPVYLFAIGFVFVYELIFRKDFRRVAVYIPVFLATIIPFFVQAYTVYGPGLAGSSTFALWRGLPDAAWLKGFLSYLVSPVVGDPLTWPVPFAIAAGAIGVMGYIRRKRRLPFLFIAAAAFLFTAYHFSFTYASRILYLVALLLAGCAVEYVRTIIPARRITILVLVTAILAGTVDHYRRYLNLYQEQAEGFADYERASAGLKANLGKYIDPTGYILATDITYRMMIMPHVAVHGLLAYKTGEYFQLNPDISRRMQADYNRLIGSDNTAVINELCRTYNITTAVAGEASEMTLPVFRTVADTWTLVFHDGYFRIYVKPSRFS